MPIALFKALKGLTGFTTVIIEVESLFHGKQTLMQALYARNSGKGIPYEWYLPRKIPPKMMEFKCWGCSYENENRQAAAWLDKMRKTLEPALRPSASGEVRGAHNVAFARYMEFHPHRCHVRLQNDEHGRLSDRVTGISLAE